MQPTADLFSKFVQTGFINSIDRKKRIMRKGIFALEALDESVEAEALERKAAEERATPEALAEAETEAGLAETDAHASEVEADAGQIEEAEEIRDTVDGLADRVEASTTADVDADGEAIPEEDRGISDETAETLEVAVEHFRNRLGFKKKVMPALEAFKADGKRKQASMEALANLRDLSARTDAMIAIAQEGLMDKILTGLEMTFTNEKKVNGGLVKALGAVDAAGKKEGTFKAGAYAGYLTAKDGKLSGKSVLELLRQIEKTLGDEQIIHTLNSIGESYKKITTEVRGNWFVSNKNDIARIHKIAEDVSKMAAAIGHKKLAEGVDEIVAEHVSPQEAKQIIELSQKLLNDNRLEKIIDNFKTDAVWGGIFYYFNSGLRLKAILASMTGVPGAAVIAPLLATKFSWLKVIAPEDLVEAEKVYQSIRDVFNDVNLGLVSKVKTINAVAKYLNDSAYKSQPEKA